MLPDAARAVQKVQKKFPVIVKNFGWAILLLFLIMIAAVGLNGFLIFIGGILFIIALQAVAIFRYIVNENFRAKEHREALELKASQKEEDDFVVVDNDFTSATT